MQDYIGKHIDRYRINEQLGMGGMAVVYKAYDTRLEREVALKLIRTEAIPQEQHERLMKRFEREAKSQARFNHPHIVPVYDYGEVDGVPYLVMACISGGTLKARTGKPVDWQQAIRWLLPVVDALIYAHKRGVIHRDIKPSNILFDEDGLPVLTDFGIAKLLESDDATLTGTGLGVGTPAYMAPEQWQGKTSPATDQYALGIVLYELLTGVKPYSADIPAAIAIQQATLPVRSPRALAPCIPEEMEILLIKILAKDPQDRYLDMAAFQRALGGQLNLKTVLPEKLVEKVERTAQPKVQPRPTHPSEGETVDELETSRPNAINTGEVLCIRLSADVAMSFLCVPAGEFTMGSNDSDAQDDEKPVHKVWLDGYWIGQTPVTNRQYQVYCHEKGFSKGFDKNELEFPVVEITWHDASEFCGWLTEKSGQNIRMPTEAEWEKAARGTDARKYPWGNENPTCRLANYHGCVGETSLVGNYPAGASPFGALDMAGNVWEWVADWYLQDYFRQSTYKNPQGPDSGIHRVFRGGSWGSNNIYLRVSSRQRANPGDSHITNGFRCLLHKTP